MTATTHHEIPIIPPPILSHSLSTTPGLQPNTNIPFIISTLTSTLLPPVPLRPQGIARLLEHYPDRQFVDNLTAIAIHGARIGYEGPLLQIRQPNHASAWSHPDIIRKSIEAELQKGRVKKITSLP